MEHNLLSLEAVDEAPSLRLHSALPDGTMQILSLSDRYWINDTAAPQQWKAINFFDNNFTDDLGILTLGQQSSGHPNLMSPNSTAVVLLYH